VSVRRAGERRGAGDARERHWQIDPRRAVRRLHVHAAAPNSCTGEMDGGAAMRRSHGSEEELEAATKLRAGSDSEAHPTATVRPPTAPRRLRQNIR
jgi:hypothetical protein